MKKISHYVILLITLTVAISACKKSTADLEETLDANLTKSAKKYAQLVDQRTNEPGTFDITNISRNQDILTISVKGGCKEEDFKIVWDGLIMLSYPGQVRLVLHNTSPQTCAGENEFSIKVNLKKILDKQNPKDFIFHVANGSEKKDTSLNPDGSVSSK